MIVIKSKQELDRMREAGKVCGWILRELANIIQPGISTLEIDRFVEKTVREHGMRAAEKGYCGYPASGCVSVNDEGVHGIPSKTCGRVISSAATWLSNTTAIWQTRREPMQSARSVRRPST